MFLTLNQLKKGSIYFNFKRKRYFIQISKILMCKSITIVSIITKDKFNGIFLHKNVNRGAKFSPCKKYRFQLLRLWDDQLPIIMFLMLNPSSADAHNDDPTIRRCANFTKNRGYGGFYIGKSLSC